MEFLFWLVLPVVIAVIMIASDKKECYEESPYDSDGFVVKGFEDS